jgi:hypothetical protein
MSYDHWKTTDPADDLRDEGDFRLCERCNYGLSLNEDDEWVCERCDAEVQQK